MKKYLPLCAAMMLVLAGCEGMGKLAPVNDTATTTTGPLEAHFTTVGTSNGDMVVMLPGREILKGHYDSKNENFGGIFDAVYPGMRGHEVITGSPCAADLTGSGGVSMQCEFYNNDYNNHGFGGCRSSTGALYKLTY